MLEIRLNQIWKHESESHSEFASSLIQNGASTVNKIQYALQAELFLTGILTIDQMTHIPASRVLGCSRKFFQNIFNLDYYSRMFERAQRWLKKEIDNEKSKNTFCFVRIFHFDMNISFCFLLPLKYTYVV